jgi:hypothetical protein
MLAHIKKADFTKELAKIGFIFLSSSGVLCGKISQRNSIEAIVQR